MKAKKIIKFVLVLFFVFVYLSCSENFPKEKNNLANIDQESFPSFEDNPNFVGYFHNIALDIFYRDKMDVTLRHLIKESLVTISSYDNTNAFVLHNRNICIDLPIMLGEKIVKEYNGYFTEQDLDVFKYTYNEIYPSLISISKENPELHTPEVFLLYCKNNNLINESLYNCFTEFLESGVMRTKSLMNFTSDEHDIIHIVETVYGYSSDYWNQHKPAINTTRIKGSTLRGALYDAIGAGIRAAISGGTASFLLSTFFSAMQNEFGEYPREVIENDGSGGGSVGGW